MCLLAHIVTACHWGTLVTVGTVRSYTRTTGGDGSCAWDGPVGTVFVPCSPERRESEGLGDRGGQSRGVFTECAGVFCVRTAGSSPRGGEAGRLDAGRSSAGIRVWCRQMDRCLYIRACLAPKVLPEFACPFLSSTVRPARPSALPEPSLCSHQGSASVAPVCSCGASRGGLTPVGEAPAVASSSSSRGCGTGMGSFPAGDGWHSARWEEQSGRAVVLRES